MIKTAIRKYCDWCSNHQFKEINLCPASDCPFYSLKTGKNTNGIRRLKTIACRCVDCRGGSKKEVSECEDDKCPLFPYRKGKNPARKGLGNKYIQNYSHLKNTSLSRVKIDKVAL